MPPKTYQVCWTSNYIKEHPDSYPGGWCFEKTYTCFRKAQKEAKSITLFASWRETKIIERLG